MCFERGEAGMEALLSCVGRLEEQLLAWLKKHLAVRTLDGVVSISEEHRSALPKAL